MQTPMHSPQARGGEVVEFIRLPEVISLVGLKTTTIYKMANEGTFPKQVKLGTRSVAWVKAEVLQWNQQQAAAARGQATSPSK